MSDKYITMNEIKNTHRTKKKVNKKPTAAKNLPNLDMDSLNPIQSIDYKITYAIYELFKYAPWIPNILGLIPYEIYILPGMYLAIFQVLWLGTPNPIQFHLLPHWFAYSIFQFLKGSIHRPRPGCWIKPMKEYIDDSHCEHGHQLQSFPSGHTGISMALATALFMEMQYSEDPHFFEFSIESKQVRNIISACGLFVSFMVGIHRVSKGYHSFFDTCTGMIIGFTIGFISWTTLEYYKKLYGQLCDEPRNQSDPRCRNQEFTRKGSQISYWLENYNPFNHKLYDDTFINIVIGICRIILSIPVLYLLFKFFVKDVWSLASIKH